MKYRLPLLILSLLLSAKINAGAALSENPSEEQNKSPLIDRVHREVGTKLDRYAQYFDNFFADKRSNEEAGDTQIRIISSLRYQEGGGIDVTPRVRARLTLPHLKRRVHLLIDTESDDISTLSDQSVIKPSSNETNEQTSIAIQLAQKSTADLGISHRIGLTLRNDQLNPKARSLVRFTWQASKRDLVRFTQSIFWERFDGFGQESRFDFEHLLRNRDPQQSSLLRLTLRGLNSEASDGYEWSLPLEILTALPNQRAYAYGASISGVTGSDSGITNSAVFFRYRQSLWREWCFVDLTPQLEWPKAKGRNTTALVTVSLEIIL